MTTMDELKAEGLLGDSGFELTAKGRVWLKELEMARIKASTQSLQGADFEYLYGIEGISDGAQRGDDVDFLMGTTGLLR